MTGVGGNQSAATRVLRFRALDSCRGLCAVAVMLFHANALNHIYWQPVVRNAYVAVDFFFVLSGFVLASAYGRRVRTGGDVGWFSLRRFGRLYPLHFVVLAIYVGLECWALWVRHEPAFTDDKSLGSLVQHLFLIQGFTPQQETWNYPAWSISVELWTNIAFAILLFASGRFFRVVAVVVAVLAGSYVVFANELHISVSDFELNVIGDDVRSVFGFFLGLLLFDLYAFAKARNWRPPVALEFVAIAAVAATVTWLSALPEYLPPLVFAATVFILAFEVGPVSRALTKRFFLRLGDASYSVYLTHSLYLLAMVAGVTWLAGALGQAPSIAMDGDDVLTLGGVWAMDAATLVCVVIAVIGSGLTYRFIEEPGRVFFNALSNGEGYTAAWAKARTAPFQPPPHHEPKLIR